MLKTYITNSLKVTFGKTSLNTAYIVYNIENHVLSIDVPFCTTFMSVTSEQPLASLIRKWSPVS